MGINQRKPMPDNPIYDTITIQRAEYERLLWLTTPKPFETAPLDEYILVYASAYMDTVKTWHGANYVDGAWEDSNGFLYKEPPKLWLPLPDPYPTTIK
jgi:hypothetical protein